MDYSEEYRKYLVSYIIGNEKFLSVWGTDMSDNEEDKLCIDQKGQILSFRRVEILKDYLIKNKNYLFDIENFMKWLEHVSNLNPYAIYDLDLLGKECMSLGSFLDFNRELGLQMLDFINLFQDYIYQINSNELKGHAENSQILLVKEYVYTNFFWNSSEEELNFIDNELSKKFNLKLFKKKFLGLIKLFEDKMTRI